MKMAMTLVMMMVTIDPGGDYDDRIGDDNDDSSVNACDDDPGADDGDWC